ncbi:unnamed protein product, partial [Meganyctiphanes norvegica]
MYYNIRRDRECILPEVSRSLHIGDNGVHMLQEDFTVLFADKNYNTDHRLNVGNIHRLEKDSYERELLSMLARAQFINTTDTSPCHQDFYQRLHVTEKDVLIIFFKIEESLETYRESIHWTTLFTCLGSFGLGAREGHKGLYRLRYGPAHLFLIAT